MQAQCVEEVRVTENEPESFPVRWDGVVLVCRQCRQRGSGPKKLKNKDVTRALRRELKGGAARPRVVLTECLGLCPKRATTIARVGGTAAASLWAVHSIEEATALGKQLGARTDKVA